MEKISASAASSRDGDELVGLVRNVLLPQEYEIMPTIVTATEGEGKVPIRDILEERRE